MVISPIVRTAIVSLVIYVAVLVAELLHSADSVHEGYPFTINDVRWGIEISLAKFLLFAAPLIALFHRYFTNLSRYVIEKPSIRQLCAPAWKIQFVVVPVYILFWLFYISHTKRGEGTLVALAIPFLGGQFAIAGSIVIAGLGVLLRWLIPRKRPAQEVIEALHLKALVSGFTMFLAGASLFGVYAIYRNASTCNTWMQHYTYQSPRCMGEYIAKTVTKGSSEISATLGVDQLDALRHQCAPYKSGCLEGLALKLLEPRLCPKKIYAYRSCLYSIVKVKKDASICDGVSSSEEQYTCRFEVSRLADGINVDRKKFPYYVDYQGLADAAKAPGKVKYLHLDLRNLNQEPLSIIAQMNNLKLLGLNIGGVGGLLKNFTAPQNIEELYLNGVEGDLPEFVYRLKNLRYLSVSGRSGAQFTVSISNKILGLKKLEKLEFWGNVNYELPAVIAKLPRLKELGVGRDKFSEKSLDSFKKARPDVKLSEHIKFPTPLDFELAEIAKQDKGVGSHGTGK